MALKKLIQEKIRLPSGSVVSLPAAFSRVEVAKPGNSYEALDGSLFALYDPSTETGLIWQRHLGGVWTMYQPCHQTEFFEEVIPQAERCGEYLAGQEPRSIN